MLLLPDLTDEQINKINHKRSEFIEELRNIISINLEALESKYFNNEEIDLNREKLFAKFCFTVVDSRTETFDSDFIDLYFDYLIVCNKYLPQETVEKYQILVRKNLFMKCDIHQIFLDKKVSRKILKKTYFKFNGKILL